MVTDPWPAEAVVRAATGPGHERGMPQRVAEALCEALPVDGVTLALWTETPHRRMLYATNAAAQRLEELQFEVGEGPCVSAAAIGRPLMVEDLQGAVTPWPLFGPLARERLSTVGAIYAFPLVEGHAHLGTADMLRFDAGPLGVEAEAAARLAVRAAALILLTARITPVLDVHWQRTHVATGVMAERLGISPTEALARLRSTALGTGRPLPDVTEDVLTRQG
ncbi:GAF and ANTAR domain-containing protein [Streptomyces sp. NPDC047070]|uniref:GAF and ANTAR domain-containing protein n=1 Tax=Streptomyces sp. NPDC047070 TaxID=3154923 RepID=UPI0034568DE6